MFTSASMLVFIEAYPIVLILLKLLLERKMGKKRINLKKSQLFINRILRMSVTNKFDYSPYQNLSNCLCVLTKKCKKIPMHSDKLVAYLPMQSNN